jgi:hypothetical protein
METRNPHHRHAGSSVIVRIIRALSADRDLRTGPNAKP